MKTEDQERLDAAERLCVLFGWTASRTDTDRDKAAHEIWSDWYDQYGKDAEARLRPGLTDECIEELARKRDKTRARTLAAIRSYFRDGT